MGKKRVYEYAKDLDMPSKDLLDAASQIGIEYKSHMSSMPEEDFTKVKNSLQQNKKTETKQNNKDSGNKTTNNQKQNPVSNKQQNNQKKEQNKNQENNKQSNNNKKQNTAKQKSNNKQQGNKPPMRTTNEQEKSQQKQRQQKKRPGNRFNRGINGGPSGSRKKGKKKNNKKQTHQPNLTPRKDKPLPDKVEYTDGMTVADLAKKLHREPAELVKKLFMMGVMANQNQSLDSDSIELLLAEYSVEAEEKVEIDITDFDTFFEKNEEDEDKLEKRPATVTIMGHVDHGKTTLLDTLRKTSVATGEAGGITQHIGAYQVDVDGNAITFLDTPGHAAFTTMRARGADVTDIAIIVVAADDGVMPQTVEAINHAKAAEVPIIVAVNKVDKPDANPNRVMQELTEYGLIAESWGGETIFVEISAKFDQNIEELLEMIILVSDVQELKANPDRLAIGTVLEARLDKAKGPIATLLVQEGTLNHSDPIVVGTTHGRIRTMTNDKGRRVQEALPSTPIEVTGLNDTPKAGDRFVVFEDEKTSRQVGETRAEAAKEAERSSTNKVTLETLFESLEEGELKEVPIVIKGDVQGSVEALKSSIEKIEVEGVKVNIIHTGVGAINESDITLANASNAIVLGFNVRPTSQAKESADRDEVQIRAYRVIYDAIDEIESAMKGMLDPEFEEQVTGSATVRETYNVSKVGTIAGCYVSNGVVRRSSSVRLIRNGVVVFEGEISSLKRFQDDAKEVTTGFECGITLDGYNDIKVDDVIEAYEMVEIERV